MEALTLEAKKREHVGRQAKKVRAEGYVPAVVYGHGIESRNISVESRQFDKAYAAAGTSTLVDLKVEGEDAVKALIQDVQYEPLYHVPIHVDFRQVKMGEKLDAEISLEFTGESPIVKLGGAILNHGIEAVSARCLPKDLVHDIKVDLSSLKEYGDVITVGDLIVPDGIEILDEDDVVVVVATEPVSQEELDASLSEPVNVDVSKVESATGNKKDEEGAKTEEKK